MNEHSRSPATRCLVEATALDPATLESELAVAAPGSALGLTLRVGGRPLRPLRSADAAATMSQVVGSGVWFGRFDGHWLLVGYAHGTWQVFDPTDCLDCGSLMGRVPTIIGWTEVLLVPIAGFWVVLQGDPTGRDDLKLLRLGDGELWGEFGGGARAGMAFVTRGRARLRLKAPSPA